MRLQDFPRPTRDNGRGLHWSPSPHPPTGGALDFWMDELHAMHIKWLKVIDDGTGASRPLCERLLQEGIMPIVRLQRAHPRPRRLTSEERETIRALVDMGVRYFEIDSEPDLPAAWGEAMPPNWFDIVIEGFIEDADVVLEMGGLPAVPVMELRPERNPIRAIVDRGRGDLFERGTWWAIHAYTLNRPLTYPDDEVNRTGRPVSAEEYEQHYPWGWNEPPEIINRWRAEGKQPDATLADDPFCFRAYELAGQMAQDVLGFPIPIIATEGGAVTGWRDDRRYPRLDPWTAAEWTVRINEFLQRDAPPWLFTVCHWLIADRRIDPSRPHAWEPHCWYTHWWDEQFGFNGVLPVVERVKAMPSLERSWPLAEPRGEQEAVRIAPSAQPEEEEPMPRLALITGHVRDQEGKAVPDVALELRDEAGDVFSARTGDDGSFRFGDVPPGTYALVIVGRGQVRSLDVRDQEVQEVEITLSPPRAVATPPASDETPEAPSPPTAPDEGRGEEVGQEEGAEEEEERETEVETSTAAEEQAEDVRAEEAAESVVSGVAPGARPGIVVRLHAQDGQTWEMPLGDDQRFAFSNLPAGTYRLEMVGIGTVREAIHLDGKNSVEIVFPLRGIIQGFVMGGTPEMMAELVSETYGWRRAVALSPQGQYRFIELPPGTYRVTVEGHTIGPVTIEGDETTVMPTLDLRPPHRATLRGRVMNAQGEVLPDIPVRLMRGSDIVAETQTALNGTYVFENMPPGDYHLVVVGPPDVVRPVHLEQDTEVVQDVTLTPIEEAVAASPAEEEPMSAQPEPERVAPPPEDEGPEPGVEESAVPPEEEPARVDVTPPPAQAPEPEVAEELEEPERATVAATIPEEKTLEKNIPTYVLLPPPTHPLARAIVLAALPFLRHSRAVAGFRVEEAQHARQVLIVGDESVYASEVETMLREAGCDVDRVAGDVSELFVQFRESARALREGGSA